MKYFKTFALSLFVLSAVISCSEDQLGNNEIEQNQLDDALESLSKSQQQNNYEFTEQDSLEVVVNANLDMISFVNSIRLNYVEGDSYEDLKSRLDPVDSLENMDIVMDNLLRKAFTHITFEKKDSDLSGIELLEVISEIFTLAGEDGITDINNVDIDEYALVLWGSDVENLEKRDCKWYQVGCHIGNAWRWLNRKPGNGGQTNLQMIGAAVGTIAGIVALILVLTADD